MGGTASPRAHPGASSHAHRSSLEARPSIPSATGVAVLRGLPARTGQKQVAPPRLRHGVGRQRWKTRRYLALCSRAEWLYRGDRRIHAAVPSKGGQLGVRCYQHGQPPKNKNRVTVATPGAANAGRDSLEARGTLKTSPQTVKATTGTASVEMRSPPGCAGCRRSMPPSARRRARTPHARTCRTSGDREIGRAHV